MHSRATIHRETVWALELPPRDPDESGFVLAQLTIGGAPGRALILDIAEEKIRTATGLASGAADASTRITTSGSRSVAKSIWARRAGSPTTSMVIELGEWLEENGCTHVALPQPDNDCLIVVAGISMSASHCPPFQDF